MKKILSISLAAAALLCACNKLDPADGSVAENGAPCTLTLSFSGAEATKVAGSAVSDNEKKINDVQVFVFKRSSEPGKDSGKLEAAVHETGITATGNYTLTGKLECTQGDREIWALVNSAVNYVDGDAANMVTDLAALRAKTSLLTDNSSTSLVMAGNIRVTLAAANETKEVQVSRMAAAVRLSSITNLMYSPALRQSGKVLIRGAYLLNVPAQQRFGSLNCIASERSFIAGADIAEDYWVSRNVKDSRSACLALTADTYSSAKTLNYDTANKLTNLSFFYAYPNDCAAAKTESWSRRATMLVVEATVDGEECIYPIQLGTLESNKEYSVSLVIHRPGSDPDDPFKPIEFDTVTPSIKVVNWSTGTAVSEEI